MTILKCPLYKIMPTVKGLTKQIIFSNLIWVDSPVNLTFIRLGGYYSPSVGIRHPETYGLDVLDLPFCWPSLRLWQVATNCAALK